MEIKARTKREIRAKLHTHFSSPRNGDLIKIRIARDRYNSGNNNVHRIDCTAIGKDRGQFLGWIAYDDEEKEYFFILAD